MIVQDPSDKNNFPGLVEALKTADLLVLSTRRRLPVKAQLDAVRAYLDSGKPLVGIRTACHAFSLPLNSISPVPEGHDSWPEFDPQVLGGHYVGHHAGSGDVPISTAPGADASPLLAGVDVKNLVGKGTLYRVNPLDSTCTPLLVGAIPEKLPEPIAWTHLFGPKKSRIFYTSLGHADDFKQPAFRRLLLNAIYWTMDRGEVPVVK